MLKVSKRIDLSFILFFLLGVISCLLIDRYGLSLIAIFMLPIFLYSGYSLLFLVSKGNFFNLSKSLIIILSFYLSFSQYAILVLFISPRYNFSEAVNLAIFFLLPLLYFIILEFRKLRSNFFNTLLQVMRIKEKSLLHILLPLIPLLILLTSWLLYPYFPGDDTYKYNYMLNLSIEKRDIFQFVSDRRPNFTPFLIFIHDLTKWDSKFILGRFLPLLSLVPFVFLFLYVKNFSKDNKMTYLYSLLLLGSPFLIFQSHYANPQLFVIFLSIPILVTLTESINRNNIYLLGLSLLMTIAAVTFHELGFFLFLAVVSTFLVFYIRLFKSNPKTLVLKYSVIGFFVVLPYLLHFNVFNQLQKILWIVRLVNEDISSGLRWKWWYVNYYTNPDGIIFSYPGLSGTLWYAYLGALVFLLFLLFLFINKQKIKKEIVRLVPIIVFIIPFAFLAEIYPRIFNQAFLPERAWVFFVIGMVIFMSCVVVKNNSTIGSAKEKLLLILTGSVILLGTLGYLYTALNRGILLNQKEHDVVKYIENKTPKNSIIISPQGHSEGVAYYANRMFLTLTVSDPKNIFNDIDQFIKSRNKDEIIRYRQVHIYDGNKNLLSSTEEKYNIAPNVDQLYFLDNKNLPPIYFYYTSYRFEKTKFVGSPSYSNVNKKSFASEYYKTFKGKSLINDENIIFVRVK